MTYVYRDEGSRAVSVVIGVMLLVSILFLAAAQYQLLVIPQEEETAEVNHHRLVSSQMGELRGEILRASSNGAQSAQKLDMGTEYERGLIFGVIPEVHQPNPHGRIKTGDFSQPIKVKNVEGLGSARNYWPGTGKPCGSDGPDSVDSDNPDHCYQSTSFHYEAEYNRFTDNPEIVYENTILYDHHDTDGTPGYSANDEYVLHAEQDLVHGRTLNLVALTGELEQSRVGASTVQTIPVSGDAQAITVKQNASGNPVSVEIPTRLPAEVWRTEILDSEMSATNADGYIDSISDCGTNCVEITMEEGEVYNLKLSRVHLTTREERSRVPVERAAYIAWKGNDRITIQENSTTEIEGQVRDRYNNPVSGIQTQAYAEDSTGTCLGDFRSGIGNSCDGKNQPGEKTSGEDGMVTYYYEAPDVDSDRAITIQLLLDDPDNTVAADGEFETPDLLANTNTDEETTVAASPRGGDTEVLATGDPFNAPVLPTVNMGHISSDNTLRIIDLELSETSTTAGREVQAYVTLDNTGDDHETATISPTSSSALETSPHYIDVSLAPGERVRYAFTLRFLDTGSHALQVGSGAGAVATNVRVRPASAGVVPGTIRNRLEKERVKKSPSAFKDGDAITDEYQEDQNIPPVEYDSDSGTFDNNAVGNLYQFPYIGSEDDRYATIEGDTSKSISDSMRVGIATNYVPENEVYTLFANYTFDTTTPDYVKLSIVNSTGYVIDSNSNYFLPNEAGEVQRAYQLTNEEADVIRSSNEVYAVIHTPSGAVPTFRIDKMWLVSSEQPAKFTSPDATLSTATDASKTTVKTGESYTLSAQITNNGDAVANPTIRLYETNSNTGEQETIRVHDVYVNPGKTQTVEFVVRQYDPGTYQYGMSLDNDDTPDSGTISVDVEHR